MNKELILKKCYLFLVQKGLRGNYVDATTCVCGINQSTQVDIRYNYDTTLYQGHIRVYDKATNRSRKIVFSESPDLLLSTLKTNFKSIKQEKN